MIVDETIANLKAALTKMAETDPRLASYLELPPAVTEQRQASVASFIGLAPYPEREGLAEATAAAVAGVPTDGQVALLKVADWLPPVVGSPIWFLEEVAEAYGQARTDYLVDELCGVKVVQREELSEPVLVFPDGKWYTIVPEWARRTAEQIASEDASRRLGAAKVS